MKNEYYKPKIVINILNDEDIVLTSGDTSNKVDESYGIGLLDIFE